MDSVAQSWFGAFMETVQTHETSIAFPEAAVSGDLKRWTEALTGIVVGTFPKLGWCGAARGHRSALLPVPRSEYMELDVVAFEIAAIAAGAFSSASSSWRRALPTTGSRTRRSCACA